jgi:DNA-binding FrmR family transcriptional regulator/predicted Fe-Mo cluster-binding NifX family protein
MRVAMAVDRSGDCVTGLLEASTFVIWDTDTGGEETLANPASGRAGGRRLAIVETLLAREVTIVGAVPLSLCPLSYAIAQAGGLRFLCLERDTPVALLHEHLPALVATARLDLPAGWLATVARTEPAPAAGMALPLSDAAVHALINRMKRLEGQARGVQRLLQERQSCEEILTQLSAMRSAIQRISTVLLAENLAACYAAAGSDEIAPRVADATRAFEYLN